MEKAWFNFLFISFHLEILAVLQKRKRYYRQFPHDGD